MEFFRLSDTKILTGEKGFNYNLNQDLFAYGMSLFKIAIETDLYNKSAGMKHLINEFIYPLKDDDAENAVAEGADIRNIFISRIYQVHYKDFLSLVIEHENELLEITSNLVNCGLGDIRGYYADVKALETSKMSLKGLAALNLMKKHCRHENPFKSGVMLQIEKNLLGPFNNIWDEYVQISKALNSERFLNSRPTVSSLMRDLENKFTKKMSEPKYHETASLFSITENKVFLYPGITDKELAEVAQHGIHSQLDKSLGGTGIEQTRYFVKDKELVIDEATMSLLIPAKNLII